MKKFISVTFILSFIILSLHGQVTFMVSTLSNPVTGGTTSGNGVYDSGALVTVIASPASGYLFVNWTEGGSEVSTSANYTFTITGNRTLIANFNQITYSVSTSSNPSEGGTTTGTGTFASGSSVTVIAAPASGYSFVNWTEGGSPVSTNTNYTFTITANRSLVANFSQITYSVTTSSAPTAGGTTSGGGSFASGSSVTITATPASGYSFVNWTEGGSPVSTNTNYIFTITASRTLVANFSQITYSVTTSSAPTAGGTTSGSGSFASGSSVTVTSTPASGYLFVNWTEGGSPVSTNTNYTFTITTNRSLVANFSQITYSVTTSSAPTAGGTTSGGGSFASGSSVTITATPASGYSFVNWTEGGSPVSTNTNYTFTITTNRSLVANFNQITYSVTTSSAPTAGGTTSGGGSFASGSSVTITATPASGYSYVNWTEGGSPVSTNTNYTFTITANRTLVANFSQITYSVSTSSAPTAGGTTNGGGTFPSGSPVTLVATPASGYSFINWTEGGSAVSTNANYTFTINTNRTLVAHFSLITYSVAASSNPSAGGTTMGGGTYNYGSTVTLTASPASGYSFTNWTEGGSSISSNPTFSFTVSGNRSFVANFSRITYIISLSSSPTAGGSASGGGTYNSGAVTTVTATPSAGYQFVNWTQGGTAVSASPGYTFTVSSNRNLVANFSQLHYIISTASNPASGGSTSGGGTFTYGSNVTVTATPSLGYQFTDWSQGGTSASTSAIYSFTVTSSRNLVANFNEIATTLILFDPLGQILHSNDTINISQPDAITFNIRVESSTDWSVNENSLWLKALKENSTSIGVTCLDNISVTKKTAAIKVKNIYNRDIQIIVQQPPRVSELNSSKFEKVSFYPNPAHDQVSIIFNRNLSGKTSIAIVNIHGRIVQTFEQDDILGNQSIDLDISRLESGQYFIKLINGSDQKTIPLIRY